MSFFDHLEELRKRLLYIIAVLLVSLPLAFLFSDAILSWLLAPTRSLTPQLYFFAPHEAFWVKFKVAFFASLIISLPYTMYQIALFVAPGLYAKERRMMLKFVLSSSSLFVMGALFAHYIVNPISLGFLLSFGGQENGILPMLSISEFLNFIILMAVGFGIAFDLPILLLTFISLGLLKIDSLIKFRSNAIILCFVIGAVLTPPDVFSQILMSLPLVLLYELTILIARWQNRRK